MEAYFEGDLVRNEELSKVASTLGHKQLVS